MDGRVLPPCPGSLNKNTWTNCAGTYNWASGQNYVGEYKDDKSYGQGTLTFSAPHKDAGQKYVGEWKDGLPNGQGTATYADGRVKEGIFENGQFKYAKKTYKLLSACQTSNKNSKPSDWEKARGKALAKELKGRPDSLISATNPLGMLAGRGKRVPCKDPSTRDICDGLKYGNPDFVKEAKRRGITEKSCANQTETKITKSPGSGTVEDRLAKLKTLLSQGLLTPDEAAAKRKEILQGL